MKIALIHDHLIQEGGAERVLEIFQEIWPQAPIYTLFYDQKKLGGIFKGKDIKTSFLQHWPGALNHYQWFLPLMPMADLHWQPLKNPWDACTAVQDDREEGVTQLLEINASLPVFLLGFRHNFVGVEILFL